MVIARAACMPLLRASGSQVPYELDRKTQAKLIRPGKTAIMTPLVAEARRQANSALTPGE